MYRKITGNIDRDVLHHDLERYRHRAIERGATDAKIITTDKIYIDERVRMKCINPRCDNYGFCANCPPHVPDLEFVRMVVGLFSYALFFTIDIPGTALDEDNRKTALQVSRLVSEIESQAYYDGHYLAVGFCGAACRGTLCPGHQECLALKPGETCRFSFKARPTMHGVGMDVFKMAAEAGWDIYPVGMSTKPDDVPSVSNLGLILIY